jgi:hypothetical protein
MEKLSSLLRVRTMIQSRNECAFFDNNCCIHSDKVCSKVCRWSIKKYSQVEIGYLIDLYWRRKDKFNDNIIKWIAIVISIISLSISFSAYFIKTYEKDQIVAEKTISKSSYDEVNKHDKNYKKLEDYKVIYK